MASRMNAVTAADRFPDPAHRRAQRKNAGRDQQTDFVNRVPPTVDGRDSDIGLSQLFRELADDTGRLVRDEIALAKHEARQKARRLARDGGWVGAGVAVAAVGGVSLVVALALGLGALLGSYWLGTAIMGLLLLLVGGAMTLKGVQDFRTGAFAPQHTIQTLKEDAAWVRRQTRDLKQELGRR